jgi:transcriptional regulator of arginine metabolism
MNKNSENNSAGNKIKRIRQAKILEIIGTNRITTQDELTRMLKEAGFEATQATVSRDIRELQLTKSSDENGAYKYTVKDKLASHTENKYEKMLIEATISCVSASNLVVLKTYSGMANAAGAAIDRLGWSEVAGSIAGDDTIFIACRTVHDATVVLDILNITLNK